MWVRPLSKTDTLKSLLQDTNPKNNILTQIKRYFSNMYRRKNLRDSMDESQAQKEENNLSAKWNYKSIW